MPVSPLPDRLTILYTACLRGQIEALPRLFTLIKRERAAANPLTLLIDLGESCVPGALPCDITGGRALLVAMDALGYDAFFLDRTDPLYGDREMLGKLQSILVTPIASAEHVLPLIKRVPEGQSWPIALTGYANTAVPDAPLTLCLGLVAPVKNAPRCEQGENGRSTVLLTDRWDGIQLGRLDVSLVDCRIEAQRRLPLSSDVPPDPTISGVIDFVLGEARYAQHRGQRKV